MMNMLLAYQDQIPTIKVGTPLLTEEEDYKEACEIVMQLSLIHIWLEQVLVMKI